jgi:ABC-type spermidine/putrescine transport system permease subunit II
MSTPRTGKAAAERARLGVPDEKVQRTRAAADRHVAELPRSLSGAVLAAVSVAVLLFLCLPIVIIVPMSFSAASSLEFPPRGLSLRWYEAFFGDARWLDAAYGSILLASVSSVLALLLGSAAAYGLVRGHFRGRGLLEANFMAPMIIPAVVVAVALYLVFARLRLLGSFGGLVVGHTVLSVPFVVLILSVAIRSFDIRIEQVAFSLGASWPTMFVRVLLPNLLPSVLAAWLFAFTVSFDEVIVTVFLSGTYDTIPKRMFNELILQINPTITAIATLLIAFNTLSVAAVAYLVGRKGAASHQAAAEV